MVMKGGEKLLEGRGRADKEDGIRTSAARLNSPEIEGAADSGVITARARAFTEIGLIAIRASLLFCRQGRRRRQRFLSLSHPLLHDGQGEGEGAAQEAPQEVLHHGQGQQGGHRRRDA